MHRWSLLALLRLTEVKRFFVHALKLGLILTPAEQKAIVLLVGLFILGCLYKAFF